MRKIIAFNFITINGFFKGPNEDTSWHLHGEEGNEYSISKLKENNILLFGRKTYEMMFSFWPTQMAQNLYPVVAEKMNSSEKLVFSNSLKKADWENTQILSGNAVEQIRKIKSTPGKNISILGSGSVINQLTNEMVIDEYEFLIDPIAFGKGTPVFENISQKLSLKLKTTNVFKNSGMVLLVYETVR